MEFIFWRFLSKLVAALSMDSEHIPLVIHGLGPLAVYHVTEDELDRIVRDGNDLGLECAFAQFGFTVALSFLANLLITPMALGKVYVTFVVIIAVGFLFGTSNAIKWYRNRKAFSRTIRIIRDRQVGPVGKQGKEVSTSELNSSAGTRQEEPNS